MDSYSQNLKTVLVRDDGQTSTSVVRAATLAGQRNAKYWREGVPGLARHVAVGGAIAATLNFGGGIRTVEVAGRAEVHSIAQPDRTRDLRRVPATTQNLLAWGRTLPAPREDMIDIDI